jgi:hypothetical protein
LRSPTYRLMIPLLDNNVHRLCGFVSIADSEQAGKKRRQGSRLLAIEPMCAAKFCKELRGLANDWLCGAIVSGCRP